MTPRFFLGLLLLLLVSQAPAQAQDVEQELLERGIAKIVMGGLAEVQIAI